MAASARSASRRRPSSYNRLARDSQTSDGVGTGNGSLDLGRMLGRTVVVTGSQFGRATAIHATTPAAARPANTPTATQTMRDEPAVSGTRNGEVGNVSMSGAGAEAGSGAGGRLFEPVEPFEQRLRLLAGSTTLDRRAQKPPRRARVTTIERGHAGVQQLLAFALPFRDRSAGPIDIGLGSRVPAIEEQDARPDADRKLVVAGEVIIEAAEQQPFDARVFVAFGVRRRRADRAPSDGASRYSRRPHSPQSVDRCEAGQSSLEGPRRPPPRVRRK